MIAAALAVFGTPFGLFMLLIAVVLVATAGIKGGDN